MAKRNPMNKRYQKDAQIGSTRKSAAAAKPKRSAGAGSSSSRSRRASSSKRPSTTSRRRVELPPELKKLQKISFGLLGGAVLLSLLYLWKGQQAGVLGSVMLGVAYALMFTAIFIDFGKIRPWIKAKQAGVAKAAAPVKDAKPEKVAKGEKGEKGAESVGTGDSTDDATR